MKSFWIGLFAGVLACAVALPFSKAASAGTKETLLHSFGSGTDGMYPSASVIDVKGTLYGTTYEGGTLGVGTVFAIDPKTGAEKTLHSFCTQSNCADGDEPVASLIDVKGTLYGTASGGGGSSKYCPFGSGCGTVFSLDPDTGTVTTVYSFCSLQNCTDGEVPEASLIVVKGTLYGTAFEGGSSTSCYGAGCGAVFALDPTTGAEKVLYSFCSQSNCADGKYPLANLIDLDGTLYGTTLDGGAYGYGILFSLDPSTGAETVLHSFGSGNDGASPEAGLIAAKGDLYGTTEYGGSAPCSSVLASGCGTVFAFDPKTGAESVVYSFCSQANCTDGSYPTAPLTRVRGRLYGTTSAGGANDGGTVFALDLGTGAEAVIHSFGSGTDGQLPEAGVIDAKGTLYGTTLLGDANNLGTAFTIKEP